MLVYYFNGYISLEIIFGICYAQSLLSEKIRVCSFPAEQED